MVKPRKRREPRTVGVVVVEDALTGMSEEQADWDATCCALAEDHDGPCTRVCSECNGTQRCRECDDRSVDDWGGCGTCEGVAAAPPATTGCRPMTERVRLDPVTLRALAAELDDDEAAYRRECLCPNHRRLAHACMARALEYRTRAIKAEQAGKS